MIAIDPAKAAARLHRVVVVGTGHIPYWEEIPFRVEVELADLVSLLAEHDRLLGLVTLTRPRARPYVIN